MSSTRRSFRGFKLPVRRPLVKQTPSRDDSANPSVQPAQGSGSSETVDTLTACQPTPSRDDGVSTSAQPAQG
jgi:hypothetical protein